MRTVAEFSVLGKLAVPWKVPHFGSGVSKSGKRFRFGTGTDDMKEWKEHVKTEAKRHLAEVHVGPVKLSIYFVKRTPPGKKDGQIWEIELTWNQKKQQWVKKGIRGQQQADLCNLFKGTEDALQDVIIANDGQTCVIDTRRIYGPIDGVHVLVEAIEPEDFPGEGDAK